MFEKRQQLIVWLVVVLISFIMAACGFHLRGTYTSKSQAKVFLTVEQAESELKQDLEQYLLLQHRVVDTAEQARIQLNLKSYRWQRRILSVGENGVASEYSLNYQLVYDLISDGKQLTNQSLNLQEDYVFDNSQLLSVDAQERETKTLIRKQVVQRLLRLLDV